MAVTKHEVAICDIKIGKRFRKEMGDVAGLAKSIDEIGLLHPVVINKDKRLVAGRRRLEACKQTERHPYKVPVTVIDLEKVRRGERDENLERADFTPSEKVAIIEAALVDEKKEAKARQREHGGTAPGKGKDTSGNLPQVSEDSRAMSKAAKSVGWSRKTAEHAREVVEAGGEPEVEMNKTKRVAGVYNKMKKQQQAAEIRKEPPPLPKGPFRVIAADPPWRYEKRESDPSHRAKVPYADMTIDDIKAYLPKTLPHANSILWLWTTNAHMREAYKVVDAWGFTPKTILTWVKDRMGTGDWLRGKTEHCIMAVRGKPTVTLTNQTTAMDGKRGKHSKKPNEFYELVESLCPGSKIELFSRMKRDGWYTHGLEV